MATFVNTTSDSARNIATIEYNSTASQSYTAGEYLITQGNLYKVTSAIAHGDTLTVGTNIVQTRVGDELTNVTNNLPKRSYVTYCPNPNISINYGESKEITYFDLSGSGSLKMIYPYTVYSNLAAVPVTANPDFLVGSESSTISYTTFKIIADSVEYSVMGNSMFSHTTFTVISDDEYEIIDTVNLLVRSYGSASNLLQWYPLEQSQTSSTNNYTTYFTKPIHFNNRLQLKLIVDRSSQTSKVATTNASLAVKYVLDN